MNRARKYIKGYSRIFLVIPAYLFVVGVFELIAGRLTGIDWALIDEEKSSIQQLVVTFSSLVGTILLLWLFMKRIDKEPFIRLGFQTHKRLKGFIAGLVIGASIMLTGVLILYLSKEILFLKVNFNFKELIFSVLLFTMVAVVEEMFFRGYLLKNLMLSYPKYFALLLSAGIFALAHSFNPNIDSSLCLIFSWQDFF